jgi:hypothetical protein
MANIDKDLVEAEELLNLLRERVENPELTLEALKLIELKKISKRLNNLTSAVLNVESTVKRK